jgi:hypothetical protein
MDGRKRCNLHTVLVVDDGSLGEIMFMGDDFATRRITSPFIRT